MINVKLVAVITIILFHASSSEYCQICTNHTLCKYPIPGPGPSCIDYDGSSLPTPQDLIDIVHRINERRNFVALGLAKRLSQAANMRKVSWSNELAWSAQRWVDRCDPSTRPDKHDQCRSLENTAVGQNIATILGPSKNLNVKSFVDIWFMQILDYKGSISFYNQTQFFKTNEFTQLIWAETEFVGCGKARFYIELENNIVERLVCNFAPQGNVFGKPVYAVGFPATQCPEGYNPDNNFHGLCSSPTNTNDQKFHSNAIPETSLLRVINLSNNSVKKEIDPLKNQFKYTKFDVNNSVNQRSHKIRHVINNSHADVAYLLPRPLQWSNFNNSRRQFEHYPQQHYPLYPHPQETGYSRTYHGHDPRANVIPLFTTNNPQDFRRYSVSTHSVPGSSTFRKFFQNNQCTRNFPIGINPVCNSCSPAPCVPDKCTRGNVPCGNTLNGRNPNCARCLPCMSSTCPTPTVPSNCYQGSYNCPCSHNPTPYCPLNGRPQEEVKDDTRKSPELHYYDLMPNVPNIPNLVMRSGEATIENFAKHRNLENKDIMIDKALSIFSDTPSQNEKIKAIPHKRREFYNNNNNEYFDEDNSYHYHSFEFARRERQSDDNVAADMLWQKDEYADRKPTLLKSLRYTTLSKRKSNTMKTTSGPITEPITLNNEKFEDQDQIESRNFDDENAKIKTRTEKYLSFEELMHLRKINAGDARRSAKLVHSKRPKLRADAKTTTATKATTKAATTTAATTTAATNTTTKATPPANYTINTPFSRKKFCTRKLTCTWTAFTMTAPNGSIIHNTGGGPDGGGGSRTPPGYVEGCTRTSTCTRDFMDRNRISTLSTIVDDSETTPEDEDYCERRALDVQKRSNEQNNQTSNHKKRFINIQGSTDSSPITHDLESSKYDSDCNHNADLSRTKRNVKNCCQKKESKFLNPLMTYGDLFYQVLNRLKSLWKEIQSPRHSKRCQCNTSNIAKHNNIIILFVIYLAIYNKLLVFAQYTL